MNLASARMRIISAAAGLGTAAGVLALAGGSPAAAVTCPTVNPVTHVVTPAPANAVNWSGCDLTGANLANATLTSADLNGAILTGADLSSADLTKAGLAGTILTNANLTSAVLASARLNRTNLGGATLAATTFTGSAFYAVVSGQITGTPAGLPANWSLRSGYLIGPTANLEKADLAGADLSAADLQDALITYADLAGANLLDANLTGADLEISDLSGANLHLADLNTPNLSDLTLTGANLSATFFPYNGDLSGVVSGAITGSPANLPTYPGHWLLAGGYLVGQGAILTGANLAGLDLTGAVLGSADLTKANLTGANLDVAQLGDATLTGTALAGANLDGVESGGITGTPSSLPASWALRDGYLLGPHVNLINATLTGADLSGLDLASAYTYYANLTNANLDGTDLAGALLSTGTNLTGATFTGADLANVTWDDVTCPDGSNSNQHIDGCFTPLDKTPPVMKVTGVRDGSVYALGHVPAAGCVDSDRYSVIEIAGGLTVTGKSSRGLGVFTATCSGAQDLAGNVSVPVHATYKIAYGFRGFSAPAPGSTLSRPVRLVVVFGLNGASRGIPTRTGAALGRAHDVRITLRGPGIKPATAICGWHSTRGGYFRCSLAIPGGVRTGHSDRYTITAYENLGFGFVAAPGKRTADNPEIVRFS